MFYIFLGDNCGAKTGGISCSKEVIVDYNLVAESKLFTVGLNRIIDGIIKGYKIVLLCAGKDPITCP